MLSERADYTEGSLTPLGFSSAACDHRESSEIDAPGSLGGDDALGAIARNETFRLVLWGDRNRSLEDNPSQSRGDGKLKSGSSTRRPPASERTGHDGVSAKAVNRQYAKIWKSHYDRSSA